IHSYYDPIKNSGRTSASSPNIQNLPRKRKEEAFDIRGCFVPGPGKVLYVADYKSIELRTLSQARLTQFHQDSAMAGALNDGVDLHELLAASMMVTIMQDAAQLLADEKMFAEVMKGVTAAERNAAKPANFGLPAGMGITRLKDYARTQFGQPYTDE